MRNKMIAKCFLFIALTLVFAGCASSPQVRERYFWPPPPDTPRIEWLGAYQSRSDLVKSGLFEAIVGETNEIGLQKPTSITADGQGKVYVTDFRSQALFIFDMAAKTVRVLGGEKAFGLFEQIAGVALDAQGNIYVGDSKKRKIFVFDKQEQAGTAIDLSNDVASIANIAIDKARHRLVIPDVKSNKVVVYDLSAKSILFTLGDRSKATPEGEDLGFNFPTAAAIDTQGNILICDSMNARIMRFSPEGNFLSKFGQRGDGIGDFSIIKAAAVDSEGHIYVTDGKASRISIYNEKGEVLLLFGGPYSLKGPGAQVTPGGFLIPNGIFIDQNDVIYIADQMNGRFQMFQYVTDKYLQEHPVTDRAPAAKALLPDKKKEK